MSQKQIDPNWAWKLYAPSTDQPWNLQRVTHLYRRLGFGADWETLNAGLSNTPDRLVNDLVFASPESESFQVEMKAMSRAMVATGNPHGLASAWLYRMINTTNQLQEKTTLFWHGHFATGAQKVQDAFMMQQQNELLRKHALGDFNEMVQSISKDPAMLLYLDSATNRKTHPNENYARELMELFCLGEGNYTEQDIRELAKCFTGWEVRNRRFRFNKYQFDTGAKSFLGTTGELTGEQAVSHVLSQPTAPIFIAQKLVRFFVMDEPQPSAELVAPLAQQLREDDFNVAKTLKVILGSNLFFSDLAIGMKVRSPVELVTTLLRSLNGTSSMDLLAAGLHDLGHSIFFPPSVKGWDGGRTWINSSTLLGRANLIHRVLRNENTQFGGGTLTEYASKQGLSSLTDVADRLIQQLFAVPISNDIRDEIVNSSTERFSQREEQLRSLIHTFTSLPQFQLS